MNKIKFTYERYYDLKLIIMLLVSIIGISGCETSDSSSERRNNNLDVKSQSLALAAVKMNGRWGFIDSDGSWMISNRFLLPFEKVIPSFSKNRAIVRDELSFKVGIVNSKGDWIVNPVYENIYDFYKGWTRAQRPGAPNFDIYINIDGKTLNMQDGDFQFLGRFSEGLAAVKRDVRFGYINTHGEIVIPVQYFDAFEFSEGLAAVDIGKDLDEHEERRPKIGFIDQEGRLKIGAKYDHAFSFKNGRNIVTKNGRQGAINKEGIEVVPLEYIFPTYHNAFQDGLSFAYRYEEYQQGEALLGILSKNGTWIREPFFEKIREFSEGLAAAKKGKWGFIDGKGNWAIPPNFSEVRDFKEGLAIFFQNGKAGYLNKNGKIVIKPSFEKAYDFSFGLAAVKFNDLYGYINKTGEWIIPAQFEMAGSFNKIR